MQKMRKCAVKMRSQKTYPIFAKIPLIPSDQSRKASRASAFVSVHQRKVSRSVGRGRLRRAVLSRAVGMDESDSVELASARRAISP